MYSKYSVICHLVFTILAMMKLIALFSSGYEKNHTNMKKVSKTFGSCALIVIHLHCKQKNNNNKTITQ